MYREERIETKKDMFVGFISNHVLSATMKHERHTHKYIMDRHTQHISNIYFICEVSRMLSQLTIEHTYIQSAPYSSSQSPK